MKFTFAEKKMETSEDLIFKTEGEAYVTFSIERGRFRAEITIKDSGMIYRASELTSDMYASIDSGVASIEQQIRKNKTRLAKKLREGADVVLDEMPAYAPADDEPEEEFRIVRSKKFPIKPMSPEEAILQMNLLNHEFFVFRDDEAESAVAVVYRRKNGGYGLIMDDGE